MVVLKGKTSDVRREIKRLSLLSTDHHVSVSLAPTYKVTFDDSDSRGKDFSDKSMQSRKRYLKHFIRQAMIKVLNENTWELLIETVDAKVTKSKSATVSLLMCPLKGAEARAEAAHLKAAEIQELANNLMRVQKLKGRLGKPLQKASDSASNGSRFVMKAAFNT